MIGLRQGANLCNRAGQTKRYYVWGCMEEGKMPFSVWFLFTLRKDETNELSGSQRVY